MVRKGLRVGMEPSTASEEEKGSEQAMGRDGGEKGKEKKPSTVKQERHQNENVKKTKSGRIADTKHTKIEEHLHYLPMV